MSITTPLSPDTEPTRSKRLGVRAVTEEALSTAQHDGVDDQRELVHEVVSYERLDELAAAQHADVLARFALELGDPLHHVIADEGGVLPVERLAQRPATPRTWGAD